MKKCIYLQFFIAKNVKQAIMWLADCGLIYCIYNINKPYLPLKSYVNSKSFKIYCFDVGLLGAMAGLDVQTILDSSIFTEFKGSFTEQLGSAF